MKCEHKEFSAESRVNRLSEIEDGPITSFSLDIKVHCRECNMPFRFIHPDVGLSYERAMVSPDGVEFRVPIHPNDGTIPVMPKIKGFTISVDKSGLS